MIRLILGMILKSIEILYHYVVYQELTYCCRSIMLQKQTHRKRDYVCDYQSRGVEGGGLGEGGQKVKMYQVTFSYKINKYCCCCC